MYELVNTSVPNGLIAGTHGFATVAMTKGMPDAIRVRVEGLCAYPHRTSAHDASYYSENPVNWFHLTVSGDGHVVGRTAPAEFDYTGRTNRLSRTLFFAACEMPAAGGMAVLKAVGDSFCEGWRGEPRYVTEDKALANRLRQIDRPRGADPSHWRALLGPQGAEYARRFATLLRQNLRTGKSLFFKAAKVDVDGMRLLGLFDDLINLLPDDLAAQVTFSTFAACVPNGCVCHLRGIYDTDRAFEVASTLQPWVDCERGIVQNVELLPHENSVGVTDSLLSREAMPTVSSGGNIADRRGSGRTAATQSGQTTPGVVHDGTSVTTRKKILVAAVCLLIGICVGSVFFVWQENVKQRKKIDEAFRLKKENQAREMDAWYAGETNRVKGFWIRATDCSSAKELEQLQAEINAAKDGLKQSLDNGNFLDYEDKLSEVEGHYAHLLLDLGKRLKSLQKQEKEKAVRLAKEEERKRKRQEENVRRKLEADERAQKVAAEKENERKRQEAINRPLDSLLLTDILSASPPWVEKLEDEEKRTLTNRQSIVFHFLCNGVCTNVVAQFKEMETKEPRTGKRTRRWIVDGMAEDQTSPWLVASIPSIAKVYWQWKTPIKVLKLFEKTDSVDLSNIVFGGTNEAFRVYGKHCQPIVYVVSWETEEGTFTWYVTDPNISIDQLEPKQMDKDRCHSEMSRLHDEIQQKKLALSNKVQCVSNAVLWCRQMKAKLGEYKEIKKRKANGNKEKEKTNEELENFAVSAYDLFHKFYKWPNGWEMKTKGKEDAVNFEKIKEKDCDNARKAYTDGCTKDIDRYTKDIKDTEDRIKKSSEYSRKWNEVARERAYSVDVLRGELPGEVEKKLTKDEKTRWNGERKIDKIVEPTGVGGK